MLLLDFCNIKEWTCQAVLDLYKKHRIIHSQFGARDGFEKFCVSKHHPKSPLAFALVEANEIEPWLSEDNEIVSPSKWLGRPILFPSNSGYSQLWRSLQFSKEEFYVPFLDKCTQGIFDSGFVNDIVEDFQETQDIHFLLVQSKRKLTPKVTTTLEYLKTIEDHIDWEILSIVLNQPGLVKKMEKQLRLCVRCKGYFITSRNNPNYKKCPVCSPKTSMSKKEMAEYQRSRREKKTQIRKTEKLESRVLNFMKLLDISRQEAIDLIESDSKMSTE